VISPDLMMMMTHRSYLPILGSSGYVIVRGLVYCLLGSTVVRG
jgi:hypothetical protein